MADSSQPSQQPQLCGSGCGFFANPSLNGMCSKCHREEQAASEKARAALAPPQPAAAAVPAPPPAPTPALAAGAAIAVAVEAAAPSAAPVAGGSPATAGDAPESSGKPSTRCNQCRKKVGLTGFTCKCGLLFCGQHRYAEAHSCGFDYKTEGREKLAASNPLVQASKVDRI